MQEHFGAVEADFQSYYRLDLRETLWGPQSIGVRRLWSLVNGLPPDGVVARAIFYGGRAWSSADELLSTIVEFLDLHNRMYYTQHTKPGTAVWDPVKIERPTRTMDTPEEKPKQATVAEMRQVFGDENIIFDYREGD